MADEGEVRWKALVRSPRDIEKSRRIPLTPQTMAPAYLDMGIDAQVLHRVATMASGGFDSLPHSGTVVAVLTITCLTHREAYRDVGVITVAIPVLATLVVMGLSVLI